MSQAAARPAVPLTQEQQREVLEVAYRLCTEGRITKDNAWDSDFIDTLPELIQAERGEEFDFTKASTGLDCARYIYDKRVESAHDLVFKTLRNVKQPGDAAAGMLALDTPAEGAEGGDGEQAVGGPGVRRRKAFDADQSSTLRDAKALASKAVDETFDTDPMFAKTSRLFDENSAAGLLILNYSVYDGCNIMFHKDEVPNASFQTAQAPPPDAQVDMGCIPGLYQLLALAESAVITPSIEQLLQVLRPPNQRQGMVPSGEILQAAWEADARRCSSRRAAQQSQLPSRAHHPSPSVNDTPGGGSGAAPTGTVDTGSAAEQPCPDHDDDDGCWHSSGDAMDCDMDTGMQDQGAGSDGGEGGYGGEEGYGGDPPHQDGCSRETRGENADGGLGGPGQGAGAEAAGAGSSGGGGGFAAANVESCGGGGGGGVSGAAAALLASDMWREVDADEAGVSLSQEAPTPLDTDLSWLDTCRRSDDKGWGESAWTNMTYFKSKKFTSAHAAAAATVAGPVKRRPAVSKKAAVVVDFGADGGFEMSQHTADEDCVDNKLVSLKRAAGKASPTLLPGVAQVEASSFFKLALMPKLDVEVLWKRQLICAHQRRVAAAAAAVAAESAAAAAAAAAASAHSAASQGPDATGSHGGAADGDRYDGYADGGGGGGGDDYDEDDGQGGSGYENEGGGDGADSGDGWAEAALTGSGPEKLMSLTLDQLLQAPRKVNKMEINYNRSSRPVDINSMKSMMRAGMQRLRQQQPRDAPQPQLGLLTPGGTQRPSVTPPTDSLLSFKSLVSMMPSSSTPATASTTRAAAAASVPGDEQSDGGGVGGGGGKAGELPSEAQSVHMCFICLLYLANEHGLALSTPEGRLDTLLIKGHAVA
ncbi:MAG: hypothetical protein WDW38_001291 [Sanguina aurantia]